MAKEYIGDGVYVDVEHGMLKLTTEDGIEVQNTVYLGKVEWDALFEYVQRLNIERGWT